MKKRRIVTILVAILLASFVFSVPASATSLPDSTPTVQFHLYRHLLETGDIGMFIYQNIPYTVIPDEPISQTFMWRLMNGSTELGAATPYAFNDNGYGYNCTWMYWSAAEVTAKSIVWGTSYTARLSGTPTMFTTPPTYSFTLSSGDYSTLTAPADVKAELAARILLTAQNLDINWGLGASYSLLSETETGTVLSIFGEAYFRGVIYGLQGMCPQVFSYIINDYTANPRSFNTSYVTTLENQYNGTWVQTAKAAGKLLFGTSYDLTALLVSLLVAGVMGGITIYWSGDAWHGVADARTGLLIATRLGFFGLALFSLLVALAVIYSAIRMWGVLR